MNCEKIVVYDVDDVLIGLNDSANAIVGVDGNKRVHYNINKELGKFTEGQIKRLIEAYNEVNTFKNAKLYNGAADIFDIEKEGLAKVYIHSLSYQQDIVDYKREMLLSNIRGLTPDRLWLECGQDKSSIDLIDILVEDSIDSIKKSKARMFNILIKKPYNRPENYDTSLEQLRAIEVDTLEQANMEVRRLLLMG